jgi:hypothetical protein
MHLKVQQNRNILHCGMLARTHTHSATQELQRQRKKDEKRRAESEEISSGYYPWGN